MHGFFSEILVKALPSKHCSNSTTEITEKGVKQIFKVNDNDTRMTSVKSFW